MGIHYAMGGTGRIVSAIEKLMFEEKINVLKNSEVTEILTEDKKVVGVKINNNKVINCDFVICNSDPPGVYKNLITEKRITALFLNKNEKNGLFNGPLCLLFWLKKTI